MHCYINKSLDLLNVASSADKVLILLDLLPGRFLIIFGGWLERMLIYNDYYQVYYKVGIYQLSDLGLHLGS